jgi:hypothetical protein
LLTPAPLESPGKSRPSSWVSIASTTSSYVVPSPLGDMFDSFPAVPQAPPVPILPGAYRRGVQAGAPKPPPGVSPTSPDTMTPTQLNPHPGIHGRVEAMMARSTPNLHGHIRALPKTPDMVKQS